MKTKSGVIWTFTFLSMLLFVVCINKTNYKSKKVLQGNLNLIEKDNVLTFDLTARKIEKINNLALVSLKGDSDSISSYITEELTKRATEYSGKVRIGNPSQEFEMVFDTGSANFIIASSKCQSKGCDSHKKFDASKSTTAKSVISLVQHSEDYVENKRGGSDEVRILFGTGRVECLMTQDSVCVGEGSNLCVDKLLILEAIYESEMPFSAVKFDGIIGLSYSHLSVNKRSNFLDMLAEQNKIYQKVFSFYFNKDDEKKSQVHIGGININKFAGDVYFSDVISKNYWEIKIDEIYYGNQKLNFCGGQNNNDENRICTAVVDTGTSMLAWPSDIMKEVIDLSAVDDDCLNQKVLENLKFKINGLIFNLDPEYYVIKYPTSDKNLRTVEQNKCMNAYMNLNALSNDKKLTIILGIPFLKKYYTIFDREHNRIGFAVAKH